MTRVVRAFSKGRVVAAGGLLVLAVAVVFLASRTRALRPLPPPPRPDAPLFRVAPHPTARDTQQGEPATLQSVTDGDTIVLTDQRRIRYIGIDTPELGYYRGKDWISSPEPLAREARDRNEAMVRASSLLIFPTGKKSYERVLAGVIVKRSESGLFDVVDVLLSEGLGWMDGRDLDDGLRARYLESQLEAIESNRGIWPLVGRDEGPVHGSRNGVFHRPGCRVGPKTYKTHDSALDAFRAGLRPHKGGSGHPGCWRLR